MQNSVVIPLLAHLMVSFLVSSTIASPYSYAIQIVSAPDARLQFRKRGGDCDSADLRYRLVGYKSGNSTEPNWSEGVQPPICMVDQAEDACSAYSTKWSASILDATDLPDDVRQRLNLNSTSSVLDRSKFCDISFADVSNACHQSCAEAAEQNDFLRWMNQTCTGSCTFSGMPSDWKEELTVTLLANSREVTSKQHFFWDSCLDSSRYSFLDTAVRNCTRNWIPDCSGSALGCYTSLGVDMCCLCSTELFGEQESVFQDPNTGPWERAGVGQWIENVCRNFTLEGPDQIICQNLSDPTKLQYNWKDFVGIHYPNATPFDYEVRPRLVRNDSCSGKEYFLPVPGARCASNGQKLGSFAISNIVIAALTPFFGRRTFVKKITCGMLGSQHSRGFWITAFIMIVLNISSNFANAGFVHLKSSYSHLSITDLFLLWMTRPRLNWLVVLILPWHADRQMYVSCVGSTLATELVLQIIAAYIMGSVTHWGSTRLNIYLSDQALQGYPFQQHAKLMYHSCLAWLIFTVFGAAIILWSVIGIDNRITTISQYNAKRKSVKSRDLCSSKAAALAESTNNEELRRLCHEIHHVSVENLQQMWTQLAKEWKILNEYLQKHSLALQSAERASQRLRNSAPMSSDDRLRAALAEDAAATLADSSIRTPAARQDKARRRRSNWSEKDRHVTRYTQDIDDQWQDASDNYATLTKRLGWMDCEIEEITEIGELHNFSAFPRPGLGNLRKYQREAGKRANVVRSSAIDNAWRSQRPQHDSQESLNTNFTTLQLALERCGLESGHGLASQWRHAQQADRELERKSKLAHFIANEVSQQVHEWAMLEAAWENQLSRQEKSQQVVFKLPPSGPHSLRDLGQGQEESGRRISHHSPSEGASRSSRDRSQERANDIVFDKLHFISFFTFSVLLVCFICQWLWWVGFVKLAGDTYCPPEWGAMASVWSVFSAVGILVGSSA